ncbi:MAG TPA: TetR/AcrR family transcriptional regulator [Acidimicrobiales bacterium]|nr:TetR/AcrR family transcriptional regulator [Acidimicrobiales bacterium]
MPDVKSSSTDGGGRERQRRRTRKAIVDATIELLGQGGNPSVGEIADAAEVSRRTVYLHFPSLEQLLLDATAGSLSQHHVEAVLSDPALPDDAATRVELLVRAVCDDAVATMDLGRRLIQLTTAPAPSVPATRPQRGYRRMSWIEKALEPARSQLDTDRYEQLVSALTVVIGWEAIIALHDIRGLPAREQKDVLAWTARTLVEAALKPSLHGGL